MSETVTENLISAQEARHLAETSSWLINHIIKEITSSAKQNKKKIIWYLADCDQKAIDQAKKQLTDLGYTIQNDDEDKDTIHISW